MEGTEGRTSEPKQHATETIPSEKQRDARLRQRSRVSGACGAEPLGPGSLASESGRGGERGQVANMLTQKMARKFPNLSKCIIQEAAQSF